MAASVLDYILHSERVVGQGHSSYSDTLNRAFRDALTKSGYDPDAVFPGFAGRVYNVMAFGAVGDGATDDTTAINAAITAANAAGGGRVHFPNRVFMVNTDKAGGKSIRLKSNVELVGSLGAELKAITNALDLYAVVLVDNVDNWAIRNLWITGERTTHTGGTGESGMGVLAYQATNGVIEQCYISDCWGDGIYLGSNNAGADPCADIRLISNICYNNRRNNLSVVGCHNGTAIGCGFENANGTAPQAGVDIEPQYANEVQDFIIDSCWATGNSGDGFVITAGAIRCKVVNSASVNNTLCGVDISLSTDAIVAGNGISGCGTRGVLATSAAVGAIIRGNTIRACGTHGIDTGTSVDTIVEGNNLSAFTASTRGVIDVGSTSSRVKVHGNKLYDIETGKQAIYVHATAVDVQVTCNKVTKHNTVTPATTVGAIDVNAPSAMVNDNEVTTTTGYGVVTSTTTDDAQVCHNKVIGCSTGLNIGGDRNVVTGNNVSTCTGIGITFGSGSADCTIHGNKVKSAVGRCYYIDGSRHSIDFNSAEDVSSVSGGMYQVVSAPTTFIGNKARMVTPDTAIVPFLLGGAPGVAFGNVGTGTKTHALVYVGVSLSADQGDASVTVLPDGSEDAIRFGTALTAARTVTLSTTRAYAGCRKRIERLAAATGAFGLSVGGLVSLAPGQWCEVMYNGSAWEVSAFGRLSLGENWASKTTTYTVVDGDDGIFLGGTTWTLTLQAASARTRPLALRNAASGNITVAAAGSDTVEGAASITLVPGEISRLMPNGTNWLRV